MKDGELNDSVSFELMYERKTVKLLTDKYDIFRGSSSKDTLNIFSNFNLDSGPPRLI